MRIIHYILFYNGNNNFTIYPHKVITVYISIHSASPVITDARESYPSWSS